MAAASQVVARFCFRCDEFSGTLFFCSACAHLLTRTPAEELLAPPRAHTERPLESILELVAKGHPSVTCLDDVLRVAARCSEHHDRAYARAVSDAAAP